MTDTPAPAPMGSFERLLTFWVALAMVAGIAIGTLAPGLVQGIAGAEIASINMVVAVLIWAMVYPMMVSVDFGAVAGVARQPKRLLVTLVVNWLIKLPFLNVLRNLPAVSFIFIDQRLDIVRNLIVSCLIVQLSI